VPDLFSFNEFGIGSEQVQSWRKFRQEIVILAVAYAQNRKGAGMSPRLNSYLYFQISRLGRVNETCLANLL
jgi:hypothetical protein